MQFLYLFFATSVLGHGLIMSPPARAVGPAMVSACGQSVAALVMADNTSHVEGMPEAALKEKAFNAQNCNVFLCKGLQFEDNRNNVQTFKPGQVVNMRASITIPHEGPMNVSIINTQMNMPIGDPLITFTSYADESLPVLPPNNTNFDVTIPMNLGSTCSIAGACVLQWFWFGTKADQTYESCVDMVVPSGSFANNGSTNATATISGFRPRPTSPGSPTTSPITPVTGSAASFELGGVYSLLVGATFLVLGLAI